MPGVLLETDELGVPLHRHAKVTKPLAHDPFVVVLAEDENVGIGREASAGQPQRDMARSPPFGPQVRARGGLAQLERAIDNAKFRIDLQRARLHAECSRLHRRPGASESRSNA